MLFPGFAALTGVLGKGDDGVHVWKRRRVEKGDRCVSRGRSEKQGAEGARRLIWAHPKGRNLFCCHAAQWGQAASGRSELMKVDRETGLGVGLGGAAGMTVIADIK